MKPKTALIYSSDFSRYSYGEEHPFKVQRFRLAYELMHAYGLTELAGTKVFDCQPVSEKDLLTFHSPKYLAKLKEFSASDEPRADFRYGLGNMENPVFQG
ncbi:MAG: acetoin utilization protein AcuC, partial [Deltaproteobacteria bacterium]